MVNTIKLSLNQHEEATRKWLTFNPAILCKGKKGKLKDIVVYKKNKKK